MAKGSRKPLEKWQREDAERLRALWNSLHGRVSQRKFAEINEIGDESQAIVWQYMSGAIALNLSVAIKFASGLGCRVADFSPTLGKELEKVYDDPRAAKLADMFCSLTEEEKNALMMEVIAKTVGNRALRKETGPELKLAANKRVERALKIRTPFGR